MVGDARGVHGADRARALGNLAARAGHRKFVLCRRAGSGVDYWGQVLSRLAKGTGVITADIDLASQAESRARFPALDNRQLGVAAAAAVLT